MKGQQAIMKWCCPGFEGHYNQAGQRGLGILVGRDFTGRLEVTIQYRAADKGEEPVINSEKPVSLIVDTGMRYCPWCGCDLENWYSDIADSLYRPDLKITY
jgi:hypothetical protein